MVLAVKDDQIVKTNVRHFLLGSDTFFLTAEADDVANALEHGIGFLGNDRIGFEVLFQKVDKNEEMRFDAKRATVVAKGTTLTIIVDAVSANGVAIAIVAILVMQTARRSQQFSVQGLGFALHGYQLFVHVVKVGAVDADFLGHLGHLNLGFDRFGAFGGGRVQFVRRRRSGAFAWHTSKLGIE